jgi:hypothetical protein
MQHYINLFYSVYLHIFLLFCFLTLFFWLVISKMESKNINKEIISGIKNGLKNVNISDQILTPDLKNDFEKFYDGMDHTVERNNSQLLQFNISFIILLLIGFLGCVFVRYMFCKRGFDVFEVIGENILILILVGGIEYYFFMTIASKYVPVMPSYLPNVVRKKINSL